MSSPLYTRAIFTGVTALRNGAARQVHRRSHTCAHSRSLSLAAAARQQLAHIETPRPGNGVRSASTGNDSLQVEFCDGRRSNVPYTWLRDNCQCHRCSSGLPHSANATFMALPEIIQSNVFGVVVDWNDGHISKYPGEWLHRVAHDLICHS